eukprot:EG_transcript_16906
MPCLRGVAAGHQVRAGGPPSKAEQQRNDAMRLAYAKLLEAAEKRADDLAAASRTRRPRALSAECHSQRVAESHERRLMEMEDGSLGPHGWHAQQGAIQTALLLQQRVYEEKVDRLARELAVARSLSNVKSREVELLTLMGKQAADLQKSMKEDRGIQADVPLASVQDHKSFNDSSEWHYSAETVSCPADLTVRGVEPYVAPPSRWSAAPQSQATGDTGHGSSAALSSRSVRTYRLSGRSIFGAIDVVSLGL